MFREMRRKERIKTYEENIQILEECTNGILSVIGDDGYPYGVPVSYVYNNSKIYFHCAVEGHKIDSIKAEPKVSFTVVGADNINSEKFTTAYKSVICFGTATLLEGDNKQYAMELIVEKYSADFKEKGLELIANKWDRTAVVCIEIEHMTGKGMAK